MQYRHDIDGLRAIAVLIVLFFHLNFSLFSGGFVGVDVFFVISGFLITTLICNELSTESFSFKQFYLRRIRRLVPVLCTVIFVSWLVGFVLLLPSSYEDFAKSAVSAILFVSNFWFYSNEGYFEAPAIERPLLHTWSLSVEEQYYILIPLLLAICWRFGRKHTLVVLLFLTGISFLGSALCLTYSPEAAFYLMPFRLWEIMLGSLIAFLPKTSRASRRSCFLFDSLGIAAIIVAAMTFSPQTPFPGPYALLPCLGALLVIYGGSNRSGFIYFALSKGPIVFLGRISYSLYMWHWPIIVFSTYYLGRVLNPLESISIIFVSVSIATLSYKYIEQPFRTRAWDTRPKLIFRLSLLSCSFIGLISTLVIVTNGWPSRLPQKVVDLSRNAINGNPRRAECHNITPERILKGDLCHLGDTSKPPRFLVTGDSHADALMPAFERLSNEYGVHGLYASYGAGCPPLLKIKRADHSADQKCTEFNDAIARAVVQFNTRYIVMVSRWSLNAVGRPPEENKKQVELVDLENPNLLLSDNTRAFMSGLKRTLNYYLSEGRSVWIVEQVPEIKIPSPSALATAELFARPFPTLSLSEHKARQQVVTEIFNELQNDFEFHRIRPEISLCDHSQCYVKMDGHLLYRDSTHLSNEGAILVSPLLRPFFEWIIKQEKLVHSL